MSQMVLVSKNYEYYFQIKKHISKDYKLFKQKKSGFRQFQGIVALLIPCWYNNHRV